MPDSAAQFQIRRIPCLSACLPACLGLIYPQDLLNCSAQCSTFDSIKRRAIHWFRIASSQPPFPLLLRATSHDRLFSCLWLLIIEIFLARFRLHLKNVFRRKHFQLICQRHRSHKRKTTTEFYLFILSKASRSLPRPFLPLTHLLPAPREVKVSNEETGKRDVGARRKVKHKDGRMRNADKNSGDRLPQSKQIKRQRSEQGQRGRDSTLYVDFICNSRESRNLHKQIEFCIHFLCPFSKQNIKGLVCIAPRKCCYSIFQRMRGRQTDRQTDRWKGGGGNVKRSRMCREGTYHSRHVAWSFIS